MKIGITVTKQPEENEIKAFCTQTFETSEGQIENYYVCGQGRFTVSQMWNLLKQKREFPKKG